MIVPLLDVRRQNEPIQEELGRAALRVLASGAYILGPEVERFEKAAAAVAEARYAIGVSSGTDAILAALMALEIGPGDEVLCPSFTFFATAGCVARVGARPVFVDSSPDSFNIDPAAIEPLIGPRARAILPVHLFGQPVDLEPVLEIARRRGLAVIEDTAQAFGAEYGGRRVGALGDCGTISFYPSKNLGGFGDGGLIVTNDPELDRRLRLARNHGADRQYVHSTVGGNFRLDAIQAALLSVKLPLLEGYTTARQRHADAYDRALRHLEGRLILPARLPGRSHIVNQYTIRVPGPGRRDALRAFLGARGIGSAVYYPIPLHLQQCFRDVHDGRRLPISEKLAEEVLSLPVFSELHTGELEAVVEAVEDFFSRS